MHASSPEARLAALRERVRAIENAGRAADREVLSFGIAPVDARLTDGGLVRAALHEAAPATPELGDEAAATLFLAAFAARAGGAVLWALSRRDLFAPGLAQAGLVPGRVIYAECRDEAEVLAVVEEGLRHGGLGAVVGEAGRVAMASSRRLQLAAEDSGTPALLLRCWRRRDAGPLGEPSAAVTRWRIGSAPSTSLAVPGVGRARWHVELARQRGGEPYEWILEAPDAEARLAVPARSGDRPDQTGGSIRIAA